MNQAVVGIGSNIRPERSIGAARDLIAAEQRIVAESAYITTKPLGYADQADFVNGAMLVETALTRGEFKAWLRGVEERLERVRTANRNGPRTIDLDIVAWNDCVIDPDFHTRDFVRRTALQGAPWLDGAENDKE